MCCSSSAGLPSCLYLLQCQDLQTTPISNQAKSRADIMWILPVFIKCSGLSKGCGFVQSTTQLHCSQSTWLKHYCIFMCLNKIESKQAEGFIWCWSKAILGNSVDWTQIIGQLQHTRLTHKAFSIVMDPTPSLWLPLQSPAFREKVLQPLCELCQTKRQFLPPGCQDAELSTLCPQCPVTHAAPLLPFTHTHIQYQTLWEFAANNHLH